MVRRAGLEPASLLASVFETDSYTCSGICAYGTRRGTRTLMPSRTPVPETGVSANSTSRAYWYAERGSNPQVLLRTAAPQAAVFTSFTICVYGGVRAARTLKGISAPPP